MTLSTCYFLQFVWVWNLEMTWQVGLDQVSQETAVIWRLFWRWSICFQCGSPTWWQADTGCWQVALILPGGLLLRLLECPYKAAGCLLCKLSKGPQCFLLTQLVTNHHIHYPLLITFLFNLWEYFTRARPPPLRSSDSHLTGWLPEDNVLARTHGSQATEIQLKIHLGKGEFIDSQIWIVIKGGLYLWLRY